MTDVLIINQDAVDGSIEILTDASTSDQETGVQLARHQGAVFARGALQFIQQFMEDVVDDVVRNIPSNLHDVIASYATGLTRLADVISAADQSLAVSAHPLGDAALQVAGGAALLTGGAVVATWTVDGDGVQVPATASTKAGLGAATPKDALGQYGSPSEAYAEFEKSAAAANNWGDDPNQCTTWANFRRLQLGLSTDIRGDGGSMVGGGSRALPPVQPSQVSLGSLVSDPASGAGHVMVVEKVVDSTPGHYVFTVSEMNTKGESIPGDLSLGSQLVEGPGNTWKVTRPGPPASMFAGSNAYTGLLFSAGVGG